MRDIALKMLLDRPRYITFQKISNETGLSVFWLKKFSRNLIVDPGHSKIIKLVDYFNDLKDSNV